MNAGLGKTAPSVQSDGLSKGERTRNRLLDLAYEAVIRKGFAATSIEELVEAAGITKSGFFYHFRDKNDLARQILERYGAENEVFLETLSRRARELSDDPLHSYLIFLKLLAEALSDLAVQHPGCLVAIITFQDQAFDREVWALNTDGVLAWRRRFRDWVEAIALAYPPRTPVDLDALADNALMYVYGGAMLSKALSAPEMLGRQVLFYRDGVRLMFAPG
ncbi:MAG: TetR/AcrR family transcriptional regulator [Phenylobacterium sp.]|uniref:TetR/AcrR family transcriptional regulator n=1 Tax=Phenylobacterium sp. TaxID=1871053 RepID=UPI0027344EC7|nr:TetR/AcrR family transcriptional regulator [Phenylobacterium sp.]MDP3174638.1 TetR/AcrR family transcriptional regulator [Phenylobacterium sp.]